MKKFVLPIMLGLGLTILSACSFGGTKNKVGAKDESGTKDKDKVVAKDKGVATSDTLTKTLVAYYSLTDNTESLAKEIQALTGADIFKIETVKNYPEDYNQTIEIAKKEKEKGTRPEMEKKLLNISQYDTIYIGFPIWWGTYPMVVVTFMETYEFADKVIKPFCTHGGGGVDQAFNYLKNIAPLAIHKEGLVISEKEVASSKADIEAWIK